MKCWSAIILLFSIVGNIIAEDFIQHKVTSTSYGPVKGIKLLSQYEEKEYYSYRGIPYAKPPVGELRYQPPVAHDGWKEPLEAFKFGNVCPQIVQVGPKHYAGNQDCLTLNIYAPANATDAAVMFFIHGGGYLDGNGNDFFYGPDFLINEDVILVTTNYRLGPLGFMSLGTDKAAGNMGLKDMIFSLKWVNENIKNFGGDPKRITIFGHSAGGSATHLLTLSPKTKGLFKRAIVMSGCAFNPWAYGSNSTHIGTAFKIAETMGHPVSNYDDLLKFYQTAEPKELITKSTIPYDSVIKDGKFVLVFAFSPVIERQAAAQSVFTLDPLSYVSHDFRDDIDLMFGHTSGESLFQLGAAIKDPAILKEFNDKFIVSLPIRNLSKDDFSTPKYIKAQSEVRNHYFGTNEINISQIKNVVDLTSDVIFRYGTELAVESESQRKGNTYYYTFNGFGGLNAFSIFLNLTQLDLQKASHADELCYLFSCRAMENVYPKLPSESNERKMIKNMASVFANFAKDGKPKSSNREVDWKAVSKDEINIVELGTFSNTPQVNPLKDMKEFWNHILEEYNKK